MNSSPPCDYDDALFALLKDCKTIPNFFDCVFGFLRRKTDFFVVAENPNSPVGLPLGFAESLTKHSFYKWSSNDHVESDKTVPKPASRPQNTHNHVSSELPSESYNGATLKNYSWAQSVNDIDITVKLPLKTITKNLNVSIHSQKISVKLNTNDEVLMEGELCHKIKHPDALWSITEGKLQIHLDKVNEIWWDCLLTSEDKLNVLEMDCTRPFEELSDEAQSKIEELTWNQERKKLGLKTSEQMDLENKLKASWDAKGSPFSGPFNPDTVLMN